MFLLKLIVRYITHNTWAYVFKSKNFKSRSRI